MKIRHTLTAIALLTLTLTACDTTAEHTPDPKDTVALGTNDYEPTPEPVRSQLSYDDSQTLMAAVFAAFPEDQQATVCQGVNLFGHDWAEATLQQKVPEDQRGGTDWSAAADYLVDHCAEAY